MMKILIALAFFTLSISCSDQKRVCDAQMADLRKRYDEAVKEAEEASQRLIVSHRYTDLCLKASKEIQDLAFQCAHLLIECKAKE